MNVTSRIQQQSLCIILNAAGLDCEELEATVEDAAKKNVPA